MIRVASYNMRKAIGTDRRRDPERVLRVLNEIDADIVALQEADRRFGTRKSAIPPFLLAERSGYRAVPLGTGAIGIGWHGNALLVRDGTTVRMGDHIHLPFLEPRGAVLAEVELDDGPLRVVGMHLDLSGLRRRAQAHAIIHHLDALDAMPTVLMGDLNEWSRRRGCLADFAQHFTFADCGRSYHVGNPVGELDRIMVNDGLKVIEAGTHCSPTSRRASDHYPVWATVART